MSIVYFIERLINLGVKVLHGFHAVNEIFGLFAYGYHCSPPFFACSACFANSASLMES